MALIPKANTASSSGGRQGLPPNHQPHCCLRPLPHKLTCQLHHFLLLHYPWWEVCLPPASLLASHTARQFGVDSYALHLTVGVICTARTASLTKVVVPSCIQVPQHLHLILLPLPLAPHAILFNNHWQWQYSSLLDSPSSPNSYCSINTFLGLL